MNEHNDNIPGMEPAGGVPGKRSRTTSLSTTPAHSIEVVFDLNDLGQRETLEEFEAAFGTGYTEREPLGEGRVVLRLYPGGARELKR